MRKWIAPIGLLAALAAGAVTPAAAGGFGSSAWARLNALLGNSAEHDSFKLIRVAQLAALRANPGSHVVVLDANDRQDRERYGVIPGAWLLSSPDHYNVAAELPPNKNTRLVFYCANTL
jgi:hypothetical protein